jgi:chemotaxis response regulator CheB
MSATMPQTRTGEHVHVLVVDDSAVMRQVMISVLSREPGITVDVAAHPLIARTKMERHRPDVIVLDLEMPHVDGLTFLQRIMATDPIPVLVCSALARGGADSVIRALEYGAVDVVQKPASASRTSCTSRPCCSWTRCAARPAPARAPPTTTPRRRCRQRRGTPPTPCCRRCRARSR